ncbi:uncharacterized protein LOC122019347 [Zingiber officinale]|uniref:uncharacterized protein LOC122019347 n=1 Tax=Zingiber officinale TaxID=94328 RepID=UPI001C4C7046|nr:uncharacterized protein LOC122019347 [Zingiber officinale]
MLRTYGIMLNPNKCLFGAKSGWFLGYIVTERGIEANPSKVKVLQDMPTPRNIKEAQCLTSWITALSQFISKSSDRSLPFFKILRRATKFQWDSECDRTFEELKVYPNSFPVLAKLTVGATPSDREEARLLRRRASRFTLIGDQLYKKAFSRALLKCVISEDIDYILREVHQGSYGGHPSGRSLARKILLAGYFWPTLQEGAAQTMATCLSCQRYHNLPHQPTEEMKTSTVSCSFNQWGMDIMGSFLTGQRKFLLVAVDYFSKWVEVESLARITEQMDQKFIWQHIICRFRIPRQLVLDNGRQFAEHNSKNGVRGIAFSRSSPP